MAAGMGRSVVGRAEAACRCVIAVETYGGNEYDFGGNGIEENSPPKLSTP